MDKKQKRQMALLVLMMFIGALLETMSISLVIPVVTAVIQPDILNKYAFVQSICDMFHIKTTLQFTIVAMVALILVFIAKDLFLFWQYRMMYRFVYTNQFQTAERLLRSYVNKDY